MSCPTLLSRTWRWEALVVGTSLLLAVGCFGGGGGTDPGPGPGPGVPVITAVSPGGTVGEPTDSVTFTATATNTPTSFAWSFGGGATPNTATGASATVALGAIGNYTGSVTASNASGTSSAFTFAFSVATDVDPDNDVSGTDDADETGGDLDFGDLEIVAAVPALTGATTFTAATAALPAPLPDGFEALTEPIDVDVTPTDTFESTVTMLFKNTLAFDTDDQVFVLRFDATRGEWRPVAKLDQDSSAREVTAESRVFGTFIVTRFERSGAAARGGQTVFDTLFTPSEDGFQIINTGDASWEVHHSGGWCLGMSAFAGWYYQEKNFVDEAENPDLFPFANYSRVQQEIMAIRTYTAFNTWWTIRRSNEAAWNSSVTEITRGNEMISIIDNFGPVVMLILGTGSAGCSAQHAYHAILAYAYDDVANQFSVYDPNLPGNDTLRIGFDPDTTGFSPYISGCITYNQFAYTTDSVLNINDDAENILEEAKNVDTDAFDSVLPANDSHDADGVITLSGHVNSGGFFSGSDWNSVSIYVDNDTRQTPTRFLTYLDGDDNFSQTVIIDPGRNVLSLLAGDTESENYWFFQPVMGVGTVTVHSDAVRDPDAIEIQLQWPDDRDMDLYVDFNDTDDPDSDILAYWNNKNTPYGDLDLDATAGGAETFRGTRTTGTGSNTILIRVHYFDDNAILSDPTSRASVLILNGGDELASPCSGGRFRSGQHFFTMTTADDEATGVGNRFGPSWIDVAEIDKATGCITWLVP